MSVTPAQKRVIDQVLSVFETGRIPSAESYSTVSVLTDGAGVNFGKHQATDGSDSLDAIVFRYIDLGGTYAAQLKEYIPDLQGDLTTKVDPKNLPQRVKDLEALLVKTGQDPLMQRAQDEIFDQNYWIPAVQRCEAMRLTTALAYLAIYDTCIQSGPAGVERMRKLFGPSPPSSGGDEHVWVKAYVQARHDWFANYTDSDAAKQALVRRGTKRADNLMALVTANNWNLTPGFTIYGVTIPG